MTKDNEILNAGHRRRLINRYAAFGAECLYEHELLELLLYRVYRRQNTNEIAHRLIDAFGSFAKVLAARPEELIQIQGVGRRAAEFLAAIGEEYAGEPLDYLLGPRLTDDAAVIAEVRRTAREMNDECIFAVCLDKERRVRGSSYICRDSGGFDRLDIAAIVAAAYECGGRNIIIVHKFAVLPQISERERIMLAVNERLVRMYGLVPVKFVCVSGGECVDVGKLVAR